MGLAVVRDLRETRVPACPGGLAAFEAGVLAGFVLARAAAGLPDRTVSLDVTHLEQVRAWFGRPLWEMQPAAFRGLDATLERLRADRQPGEALTCGPDPLHPAAVFGIDDTTAIRYATAARQLLDTAAEHGTPG